MNARSIAQILALAILCGALVSAFATAPALWWLSEAEKAELIAQAEAQHGPEAAAYLRKISH